MSRVGVRCTRRSFLQAMAALGSAGMGGVWAADASRVALVIGNNAYAQAPLRNAANDARAMARVLHEAGFDVVERLDCGREAMARALDEHAAALTRADVKLSVLYYAGHGVQVDWHNYLLPVDMKLQTLADLRTQGTDLASILARLPRSGGRSHVMILDACRDNPFGAERPVAEKGLSPFDAPVGTLIAFSTSPGSVASDGAGDLGLYSESLVRELTVPGLRIEDVFKRVRANVMLATRGRQVPWESTSLVGDVYLHPSAAALSQQELERQFEEEIAHWNRVKGSRNPADWGALLRAFPNGRLSEIAQARLNALVAESGATGVPRRILVQTLAILLAPGRPVPEQLARTGNPNSAGSYPIARRFSVDDTAVYALIEREGPRRRPRGNGERGAGMRRTMRVTEVDVDNDRVELNGGRFVTDLLGNPRRVTAEEGDVKVDYEVPFQIVPAELQVGRRWTASYVVRRRGRLVNEDTAFEIVARERVAVPAGEFDAFRIESRALDTALLAMMHGPRREELVRWEVPGLNFPVKQERTIYRPRGGTTHETLELVRLRQGGAAP